MNYRGTHYPTESLPAKLAVMGDRSPAGVASGPLMLEGAAILNCGDGRRKLEPLTAGKTAL